MKYLVIIEVETDSVDDAENWAIAMLDTSAPKCNGCRGNGWISNRPGGIRLTCGACGGSGVSPAGHPYKPRFVKVEHA